MQMCPKYGSVVIYCLQMAVLVRTTMDNYSLTKQIPLIVDKVVYAHRHNRVGLQ